MAIWPLKAESKTEYTVVSSQKIKNFREKKVYGKQLYKYRGLDGTSLVFILASGGKLLYFTIVYIIKAISNIYYFLIILFIRFRGGIASAIESGAD